MSAPRRAVSVTWMVAVLVLGLALLETRVLHHAAHAHGAEPIGVGIVEQPRGHVTVRVDRPGALSAATLGVHVDAQCVVERETRTRSATRLVDEVVLACAAPLAGNLVSVDGLDAGDAGELDAVLRVELADGTVHRSALGARAAHFAVPSTPSVASTLLAHGRLGAKHLFWGLDHVLFILGTALLHRRPRRAALALTAFTLGHSLTLGATAVGVLRLPVAWAEVAIAVSLLWLAIVVAKSSQLPPRGAFAMPLVVGLVHGLGFAEVLTGAGVPREELPLALVGFNLGIEVAELAIVGLAFGLAAVTPRVAPVWLRPAVAHALGALAGMWCLERLWVAVAT